MSRVEAPAERDVATWVGLLLKEAAGVVLLVSAPAVLTESDVVTYRKRDDDRWDRLEYPFDGPGAAVEVVTVARHCASVPTTNIIRPRPGAAVDLSKIRGVVDGAFEAYPRKAARA